MEQLNAAVAAQNWALIETITAELKRRDGKEQAG